MGCKNQQRKIKKEVRDRQISPRGMENVIAPSDCGRRRCSIAGGHKIRLLVDRRRHLVPSFVMSAKAGIQSNTHGASRSWTSAFAGVTNERRMHSSEPYH